MFVTRKSHNRDIYDLERSIQNLQGQITCLQGIHEWGVGRYSSRELWIRCSRCYATHPDNVKIKAAGK